MKTSRFALLPAVMLAIILLQAIPTPAAAQQTASGESLFMRLGGFDAVAAVTDDFLGRLVKDPQLNRFFIGHGFDSQMRTRQLVVEFLCNATGGPCFYTGRTMALTHKGMGITVDDWELAVMHLMETLDQFQVPSPEREEVVAFIAGLRGTIVDAEIGKAPPVPAKKPDDRK